MLELLFFETMLWLGRLILNPGALGSKLLGSTKVNSAFHLTEVNQMDTRYSWGRTSKN